MMCTHNDSEHNPNHYVFVANDVVLDRDKSATAEDISHQLLAERFWAFTEGAPLRARLRAGDKVIIYLAGGGRRYFTASVVVRNDSAEANDRETEVLEGLGLNFMPYTIRIGDHTVFEKPVPIAPLLPSLSFVKDKKNYGLHLRLPVVRIAKEDYDLILRAAHHDHRL